MSHESSLAVLSILLATLTGTLCAPAPAQFHDDFTASKVDPAWSWSDPGNDCSFRIGPLPGRMRMIVPPGNDHTTGHGAPLYAGPMLTVKATGDFTITTHVAVNYPAVPAAKESGLMIWKDRNNNLQLKRTNAFNSQNVLFYGNIANARTTFHGNVRVAANELYLRVVRAGSRFTAYHGSDGKTWTRDGAVTWNVSGTLDVGLATSYWLWFGNGTQPATGDYLFFDVEVPGAAMRADRVGLATATGGTIGLGLDLGSARAGEHYLVVGSVSGARPGITLPGGAVLPINLDQLTQIMIQNPNHPGFFPGTAGKLDAAGKASARAIMPRGLAPLIGRSMRFAAVVWPPSFATLRATNAAEVALSR